MTRAVVEQFRRHDEATGRTLVYEENHDMFLAVRAIETPRRFSTTRSHSCSFGTTSTMKASRSCDWVVTVTGTTRLRRRS